MSSKKKAFNATPEGTSDTRLSRGPTRPGAIFPVAPAAASLPPSYAATLQQIKTHIATARVRAILAANPIVIEAYWQTGKIILARQQEAGWGAKVIDRLAADLQAEFPDMSGLTRRNLFSMRAFAAAFPDIAIVKRLVSQLPWGQIIRLIQMVKDPAVREFYIRETLAQGWSRDILEIQIKNQLHLRAGKAQNNFHLTMPPADSDMATQLFKDPFLFDFLGTADPRREAEVEQALVDHIQKFLLELGTGFAFVGRQVGLEVGGEDYPLDLLFYHLKLRRYVVIELKARAFTPGDVGQLNLYLSAVDDLLRHPDDQPTIGLLLCRKKNRLVAEYALRGLDQSIAVAEWQTQLTASLPEELRSSLPTIEEIEAELSGDLSNETERMTWGVAPGWYGIGPLALLGTCPPLRRPHLPILTRQRRNAIPAQGNALGHRLSRARTNQRGTGHAQYPPSMMLGLLIYCYATGTFASRRIETLTYENVAVRFLTADTHPDHDSICKFRRENKDLLADAFHQVLELAARASVLQVGDISVAIDGTKILANASKHSAVSHGHAVEQMKLADEQIAQLLQKAEDVDSTPLQDGLTIPEEIKRREDRIAKLREATQAMEQRAKERLIEEQAAYERIG